MEILIENWGVVEVGPYVNDPYKAPEQRSFALCGDVKNHPRLGDRSKVTTSPFIAAEGENIKTLSGSVYKLGTPAAEYEKQFPNAKERLLKSLKK